MNDTQLETLDQVQQFLDGTEAISFQIKSKDEPSPIRNESETSIVFNNKMSLI
jgi:hypothetical protein